MANKASSVGEIRDVMISGPDHFSGNDSFIPMSNQKKRSRGRKKRLHSSRSTVSSKKSKFSSLFFERTDDMLSPKTKVRVPESFKHLFVFQHGNYDIPLNHDHARYVSMDCEMVGIGANGLKSALARVTIVDWNYNVLLETYVRPTEPVTDYRTAVSGITEQHLHGKIYNTCNIITCRIMVKRIIQDKILIGHGLENDLECLGISHPWYMIRDTAKYQPYMRLKQQLYTAEMNHRMIALQENMNIELDSILFQYQPRKLKDLIYEHFSIHIQQGKHSSFEDAIAAFELYKLEQVRWDLSIWKSDVFLECESTKLMKSRPSCHASGPGNSNPSEDLKSGETSTTSE